MRATVRRTLTSVYKGSMLTLDVALVHMRGVARGAHGSEWRVRARCWRLEAPVVSQRADSGAALRAESGAAADGCNSAEPGAILRACRDSASYCSSCPS